MADKHLTGLHEDLMNSINESQQKLKAFQELAIAQPGLVGSLYFELLVNQGISAQMTDLKRAVHSLSPEAEECS